ncbi:hypothetical protein [Nocardioides sp.]|uniref:hypothetical protein n=1 Tax=Nocardioides sp. TaxID=35761 RepID=UPI003527183D
MIRRTLLAASAAAVALAGTTVPAQADYVHPTVVSEVAATFTPHLVNVSGQPKPIAFAIAEAGSEMVVGGRFTQVENSKRTLPYNRSNVFAFDATTGAIDPNFKPVVDGDVWSVLSDGTSVYIGGEFKNVNGTPRAALAKLDLATGQLDPNFNPTFTGKRISDMEMRGDQLIVSGTVTPKLISLNPVTGKPTQYLRPVVGGRLANSDNPAVFKFDISPDGQHLVAVGNFLTVNGADHPRVFMMDLDDNGSSLTSWNYDSLALKCTSNRRNAQAYVQDVAFSPDSSWFALASFGYMYQSGYRGNMICDSVSRFETADLDPFRPTWINYTGGDSLKSVAVTGAAVYVQGHSRWLDNPYGQDSKGPGAVDRMGGGAVDPTTGMALAWNPNMPQQRGGYQILPTATGVWFATDGARWGGKYHRGIRFAPLP